MAGVLYQLGIHLGSHLAPANQFNESGFFEPVWLSRQLRQACDEPRLIDLAPRDYRINLLRQWLYDESQKEESKGKLIAAKHPLFCLIGDELIEAWGGSIKIIAVYRPFDASILSLERTGWWTSEIRAAILKKLHDSREKFVSCHDHLKINYDSIINDPSIEIGRIIDYLNISPQADAIARARDFIKRPHPA